jgi:hypothetical protein
MERRGLGVQQGRGGMGSHTHGTSGRASKSPKLRLAVRMEAERDERKPRAARMVPSPGELLHPRWPKR